MIILSSVIGMLAGLASTALLGVINFALANNHSKWTLILFCGLCVVIPLMGIISKTLMILLTSRTMHDLQLDLCGQILNAPYSVLEDIGPARLLATITEDIPAVTNAIANLPFWITQVAVMVGCLIYLGWLSRSLLFAITVYMLIGLISYQLPFQQSMKHFRIVRETREMFFRSARALIDGNKELKLQREFRNDFIDREIAPALRDMKTSGNRANIFLIAAAEWGQILFYIFIGSVIFLTPHLMTVDHNTLTGYTLTVLFMASPLIAILNAAPIVGRASVASDKIETLGLALRAYSSPQAATETPGNVWSRLDLKGITHAYRRDGSTDEFCLGPLNITLHPGEMVFLIGGNGSGKSTLAKILVGLYEPMDGYISIDDEPVTPETRDSYRQWFSVVFCDFYLFERLHTLNDSAADLRITRYLEQLQLDHKVSVKNGRLSTLDLSQGQRKRLALLAAFVQDRPVYVFDEWASDQDPMFKQLFYRQILPDLKSRGKTVIVISHDDRYYDVADRVIKLESGQIESDRYHPKATALPLG
jgi:putative pyoverdin transport system ATP-binding/permease protein